MDKNNLIGIALIAGIFLLWMQKSGRDHEAMLEEQRIQDSIAVVNTNDSIAKFKAINPPMSTLNENSNDALAIDTSVDSDSLQNYKLSGIYGAFSNSAKGTAQKYTIENEKIIVEFSNKGGYITKVQLKDYKKIYENEENESVKTDLLLLNNPDNQFSYELTLANSNVKVNTKDLFFQASPTKTGIKFIASGANGQEIVQNYEFDSNQPYSMDYSADFNVETKEGLKLNWANTLDRIERNVKFEKTRSTLHYKESNDDPTYLGYMSDGEEEISEDLKWVSASNQFFNTAFIAEKSFKGGILSSKQKDDEDPFMKTLAVSLNVPSNFKMKIYNGPNDFETLQSLGDELETVIPFGWSVIGTLNRWVIRPIFNFFKGLVGNMGIAIILLTLLVKLLVYPLTYKMLYSQSKMAALKPRIAQLKEKYKDDAQAVQMETMKMYREYGVNPLGGCFPMILQMPIWFALFRFFPSAIDFRQESFLWASDLSSYDVFYRLPYEIPFYGGHVSLLTILWAGTTLLYTYYNSKHMDMSANPMMKYMQYMMPLMFLFFFNNYAAGLTTYMLFSNVLNIGQTLGTKKFLINQDKIEKELQRNKEKPKKKSGFSQRLEKAMKEQQLKQGKKK